MKKNYLLLIVLFLSCNFLPAQKLILVNGGQFGNPQERVNVQIYDPNTKISSSIDTIQTNSVQEILIEGDIAYVAAQDSIIKYDLTTEQRLASTGFNGFSTKSMAIYQNHLLVGNWYGKSSHNLYIYDKNTLVLVDSIPQITKGVSDILVLGSLALIPQNSSTSNFEDTLGYITLVDLDSLEYAGDITFTNYTQDIGQLVQIDNAVLAINSFSNSLMKIQNFQANTSPLVYHFQQDIEVLNPYQYSVYEDTLFLKWNGKLGSVDLSNFNILDTTVVDTVVTAFALDTVRKQFYITQTDFFSYKNGGIYKYDGTKSDTLSVGHSPEIAIMYFPTITSLEEAPRAGMNYRFYPNPASNQLFVELIHPDSKSDLRILDINGRVLMYKKLQQQKNSLRISDLKAGVYIIQIQSNEGFHSSKLIKQ